MESYPELPQHLINIIIKQADLDIDTRLKLRVKPSKIKFYDVNLTTKLKNLYNRRAMYWRNHIKIDGNSILDEFDSPSFDIGIRQSVHLHFVFWYFNDSLRVIIRSSRSINISPSS